MNYLAHIYLSGDDKLVTIGNFMADSIKGNTYLNYNKNLQIGILLHRYIDSFTDAHPIVKQSKKRLYKKYGHFAGIIVDILYDHFLAKNWSHYSNVPLKIFTETFYEQLNENYNLLPSKIQKLMPFMLNDNWLLSYATTEGITKVLEGMNRRTKNKSKMNEAVFELKLYYSDFEYEFSTFFEELIMYSEKKRIELIKTIL